MYFIPYIFFFIFLYTSQLFLNNKESIKVNYNTYSYFLFFSFVILCFVGLRGFVENDWISYYPMYKNIPYSLKQFIYNINIGAKYTYKDFGFSLFAYICHLVCPNYFFFQFVCFFFDFVVLYKVFTFYGSKNIALNFLFFFLFSGTIIEVDLLRNSKAIVLFLYSLRFVTGEKKCFWKYFLVNLIAAFFHISAIVFIPLYFILGVQFNRKFYYGVFIVVTAIFVLHISILVTSINKFLSYIPNGRVYQKLLNYITNDHYSSASVFSMIYIERIFSFLFLFHFYPKLKDDKKLTVFFNIHLIYYVICFFCWDFYIVVQRFSLLFISSYWILYPAIYTRLKNKSNKVIFIIILFMFGLLKFSKDYSQEVWKYTTAFNETSYKSNESKQLKLLERIK